MKFCNGYGGFSDDGKEYIINLKDEEATPAPWCNCLANEKFGCIISESGGGWTWFNNSREFKITEWSNDSILDPTSEILEFNMENEVWRVTEGKRTITHGFGFSEFQKNYNNLNIKQTIFVPLKRNSKVIIVNIENTSDEEKKIAVKYKIKPVLGISARKTWHYIESKEENEILVLQNQFSEQFPNTKVYLKSSLSSKINTNKFYVGTNITIAPKETKEFYFELGILDDNYNNYNIQDELREVKSFWQDKTRKTSVQTGDEANDILLGGWLIYQTISSRIWARSGFYQCGGAFGFRDQLQDCLGIFDCFPELAKEIILQACEHQYLEGDVQHWFHLPRHGVRTRISDDLLWLPYVVMEYVKHTKDSSIWDTQTSFLKSEPLGENEHERYENPEVTEETASVREHCRRAIEHSLKFGERGLPLIGGGDWNDGFSSVGDKGKGESVWLAFFLIDVLQKWGGYDEIIGQLKIAVNTNGWDGEWFRRAFYDDGTIMGSKGSNECEIDSISQSWAVISGGGDKEKCKIAIKSAVEKLVDEKNGIIKLLTPPFGEGEQSPGYIEDYAPGVRENGAQYTHAACWLILALYEMGEIEKAKELFSMINPIDHSDKRDKAHNYKCEPYVLCGDVYSAEGLEGVGGWSWYTGSASWLQMIGSLWKG